jgi:hypothetical protein
VWSSHQRAQCFDSTTSQQNDIAYHKELTIMLYKRLASLLALLAVLLAASNVFATSGKAYIQINHSNISVTGTEQPSIVVQLGNQGRYTLENIGVACGWNQFIRGVAETQDGPFGDPNLILASTSDVFDGFTVFAWDESVDIPAGQNHNVAFKMRFALPSSNFKGKAGDLRCFLTDGPAVDADASDIIARSSTIPVNIH